MADDKTVRGTNFTCFHAGPMEGWAQFHMDPPEVPRPARGKLFLRKFLGSAGLEMSLNVVPPGKGIPLEEGMVLAVEPMVTAGRHMVRMGDDGWAIFSQDGSLAAHFEFTIAITRQGPRILTPWHHPAARAAA